MTEDGENENPYRLLRGYATPAVRGITISIRRLVIQANDFEIQQLL